MAKFPIFLHENDKKWRNLNENPIPLKKMFVIFIFLRELICPPEKISSAEKTGVKNEIPVLLFIGSFLAYKLLKNIKLNLLLQIKENTLKHK